MFRSTRRDFALAALATMLALAGSSAQAQVVKPWKIRGDGVGLTGIPLPGQPARAHNIVGLATHMGKHTGLGSVQTDTAVFHPDGSITGEFQSGSPFVFTAANGDILKCNYGNIGASTPGTFELTPTATPGVYVAHFIAEFAPIGAECTGKFAGVSGRWTMFAVTDPFILGSSDPVNYSWMGSGSLTFQQ